MKWCDETNLKQMMADLLLLPPRSKKAHKLRRSILDEEYERDKYNAWVATRDKKG